MLYGLSEKEGERQDIFRKTKTEFSAKIASLKEFLKDKLQGGGISQVWDLRSNSKENSKHFSKSKELLIM